jgi:hypothetical protein
MTRLAFCAIAPLLVATFAGLALADDLGETLEGAFVWTDTDDEVSGDLKAVFTKNGDAEWNVAFHFQWGDEPRVWTGTATGNLHSGTLSGRVTTDTEPPHTYTFTGEFKDGIFDGTHAGIHEDGESRHTGTLTLGR